MNQAHKVACCLTPFVTNKVTKLYLYLPFMLTVSHRTPVLLLLRQVQHLCSLETLLLSLGCLCPWSSCLLQRCVCVFGCAVLFEVCLYILLVSCLFCSAFLKCCCQTDEGVFLLYFVYFEALTCSAFCLFQPPYFQQCICLNFAWWNCCQTLFIFWVAPGEL